MKKILLSVLLAVLIAFACTDRDDELTGANIRINNKSNINFTNVQVRVDTLVFENIAPDAFSEYLEFETAYAADNIIIETDSTQFSFTPDSIRSPLPVGLYTYELSFNEEGEVVLNFRVD
ncbi:hypothetical protein MTsPCn9_32350 [Croceitalea sp. MTPC9]|uniref:hypothetical protein n=1 Tax=unclassified Croceitalea TaxID=2632280 RepID=UPI002B3CD826|nr:hypothetical protein MTsPCn6_32650 [Croceitalea sp. MTPC6]GMN18295.1 hypothetical protein MTsPCn9_32350 [Croceitalea sp. MTPC9]